MDIRCTEVEQYLHEHIPVSSAMGVSITTIDAKEVVLAAPLLPNINHRGTGFGGSISTLAILSAWTLVHIHLQQLAIPCRIVIQSHSMDYIAPVEADFQAHCPMPSQESWAHFLTMVSKRGKGRIQLQAAVYSAEVQAARFQGTYVALR